MITNYIDRVIESWDKELISNELGNFGKEIRGRMIQKEHKSRVDARRQKRDEILQAAKEACKNLGGHAMIDERYMVVDTKHYSIKPKEK